MNTVGDIWEEQAVAMTPELLHRRIHTLRHQLALLDSANMSVVTESARDMLCSFYVVGLAFERDPSLAQDPAWRAWLAFSAPALALSAFAFERWHDEATALLEIEWTDDESDTERWPWVAHAWSAYRFMRALYADHPNVVDALRDYCADDDDVAVDLRAKAELAAGSYKHEIPLDVPAEHWWWWHPNAAPPTRQDRAATRADWIGAVGTLPMDLRTDQGRAQLASDPEDHALVEALIVAAADGRLSFESEVFLLANLAKHGDELPLVERWGAGDVEGTLGPAAYEDDFEDDDLFGDADTYVQSARDTIARPDWVHLFVTQFVYDTTPSSRPMAANAAMAWSISASVCAADSCTRIRACPFGTTG